MAAMSEKQPPPGRLAGRSGASEGAAWKGAPPTKAPKAPKPLQRSAEQMSRPLRRELPALQTAKANLKLKAAIKKGTGIASRVYGMDWVVWGCLAMEVR